MQGGRLSKDYIFFMVCRLTPKLDSLATLDVKPEALSFDKTWYSNFFRMLEERQHFVETEFMYSFQDLLDVNSGVLSTWLGNILETWQDHILGCILCRAKVKSTYFFRIYLFYKKDPNKRLYSKVSLMFDSKII